MTGYERTLLQEIANLPESRRADVLAFVRYLRLSLMDDAELERSYDAAIAPIRETAERYHVPSMIRFPKRPKSGLAANLA